MKKFLKENDLKGKLDLVFSTNDGGRDKMITSYDEIDNWIKQL